MRMGAEGCCHLETGGGLLRVFLGNVPNGLMAFSGLPKGLRVAQPGAGRGSYPVIGVGPLVRGANRAFCM